MDRLPWQRDGEDFIAYPEEGKTDALARIRFEPNANEAARCFARVLAQVV